MPIPRASFSRIISENGGRENAFTSKDYTAYFQRLEKSRLAVSFELEADRMRNLHLQDKEFQKEINVVMEERRLRTEDKPTSLTYEQFVASAFVSSSVRIPTIGWMNDLENMQLSDLQAGINAGMRRTMPLSWSSVMSSRRPCWRWRRNILVR